MANALSVDLTPRLINVGHCWQSRYFAGAGGFTPRRFHAVVVHFKHPDHGECLIDTGYGPDYWRVTRSFPERFLRWVTPLSRRQPVFGSSYPACVGVDAARITTVFVSHFHADHIGGLRQYPAARLVYRQSALDWLSGLGRWRQIHQGFLAGLLPDDLASRGESVGEEPFERRPELGGLSGFDYWGDGSLWLVDLPGHAVGQMGFVLTTAQGRLGYAVDAFWDGEVWERGKKLPWLARKVQHSWPDYEATQAALRRSAAATGITWLGTHCPRTQAWVTRV